MKKLSPILLVSQGLWYANLTVILAEKNCKIMHYSLRYLYICDHISSFILQISLPTKHYFAIFFSKNDCKIEQVVLHSINPQNSTKDRFSQRKSLKFFFHKCQMNWKYVELCARLKKKKTFFWGFTASFADC